MISRRAIVALPLLGAASAALSQTRKARVGIATADTALTYKSAFLDEMAVLGWREGDNLEIIFADARGDPSALGGLVSRLVDSRPDVIVSSSNRTHFAVRDMTRSIPVVAVAALDPIRIGLSDSLSRPSRNFTGNIGFVEELMAKRVELLKEVLPKAQRIGLMLDPNNPAFPATHADAEAAAKRLGMTIVVIGYSTADEVLPSVDRAAAENVDALIVAPDAIALSRIRAVAQRAQEFRLPALTFNQGDLDSDIPFVLGGDRSLFWREAAGMVDKLLKGASVGSIPFSRPTKVYLGVNSRVARTLGIELPSSVLARADEIVD